MSNRARMGVLAAASLMALVGGWLTAADKQPDLDRFQGRWQVVELVQDGKVIPSEAIRDWLPSSGKLEVTENAILFVSHDDGKKHAKVFSLDATVYPHTIDISTPKKKDGEGIYRFDKERLILCLTHPEDGDRPDEFSAKEGSKRTLMVLERQAPDAKLVSSTKEIKGPKDVTTDPGATAKILTDAETKSMLKGTWKYNDAYGSLFMILEEDGSFTTVREVQELRLFHKTFVQTPISSGNWSVHDGQLVFLATASIHAERINHKLPFTIRSISDKDLIFVDYLGRLGQATKVK